MQRIAVIGSGAAGSAVVAELLQHRRPGTIELVWVRGARDVGRGAAYATQEGDHLLNVRAATVGLFADAPGDFLAALQRDDDSVRGSDFVARRRYGDYLEATLTRVLDDAAARGHTLRLEAGEAQFVSPRVGGGLRVGTQSGPIDVDAVVLALGALPPCPLPVVRRDACESGRYLRDPWRLPDFIELRHTAPRHVLVVGAGLTAVDTLLSAARHWPQAQLTAVSRHGRLPHAHSEQPAEPFAHQAELNAALLEQPRLRHWLRLVRETLCHEPALDWRALIDGLRSDTPALWQALDANERRRFLRHLHWLWETVRHRMPPVTAETIARLCADGRLRMLAGRVRDVYGEAPLAVRWQPRGRRETERLEADLVIQATGLHTAVRATDHALMRQLVEDGLVAPDPLDLGLAALPDGRLRRPDGTPWDGLRALGTLLRGTLWECSGLPEIRIAARRIALEIAA